MAKNPYNKYNNYSSYYGGYNTVDSTLKFQVTESYKALRANMLLSVLKKGSKSFVITSACPSEGKSTISANIAISIAQTEAKVLLLDTDLRRPMVSKFMDFNNTPGLTDVLGGMAEIDDIIHQTKYENLFVVCAGINVPNPAEILGSESMLDLLKEFEERFDYVIIDSPPINTVSDALSLVKVTDGVMLVVREGQSTFTEVDKAIKTLEFIDAKILGLVLNGVQSKATRGYKYKYRYRRGYGYGKYGRYGRYGRYGGYGYGYGGYNGYNPYNKYAYSRYGTSATNTEIVTENKGNLPPNKLPRRKRNNYYNSYAHHTSNNNSKNQGAVDDGNVKSGKKK